VRLIGAAARIATGPVTRVALVALVMLAACTSQPRPPAAKPAQSARPAHSATADTPAHPVTASPPGSTAATPGPSPVGSLASYRVGEREMTFTEPAHTGPTGAYLGARTLVTDIRYPRGARGPLPLIMFGPGYMLCAGPYADLLRAWASAGYVVAAVNFPRTNCHVGAPYEPDLVNQPADLSYVLGRLLALSAQPRGPLAGLLSRDQIGAAGHSDGGDTVAALAANPCCADHRLRAVAVLSGAEWPPMPGRYFARGAPPMLFVQGSADTINPPWTSLQLYRADPSPARYYLDLFGASHWTPYLGVNGVEQIAARVTLAFFNRYLLGRAGALAAMERDGSVRGAAALVSGGHLPPG
jgi:fermentation-respiration switch protein FrsA (DUF1100 family)